MTVSADDPSFATQPILQALPPAVAKQLSMLPMMELPAGTQVFETRMKWAGFPIILSRTVRVFKHLAIGRRVELYRVTSDEARILPVELHAEDEPRKEPR